MSAEQIFLSILIVVVFSAFVKEWVSAELVAMGALLACVLGGVLSMDNGAADNALSVFSNPAPITVACMFILSAALERTGVIDMLGIWFERLVGTSPLKMLGSLILIVAVLSGFVNNTPVVVVFMPIVLAICRKQGFKASKYLIPLSYAAIVGGTMTIIGTSTNLIASGIAQDKGMTPFTMFEIMPLGLVFVGVTFVYLMTVGRKLLPDRVTLAALIDSSESREFITHAFVKSGSPLIGTAYVDTEIGKLKKVRVLEVMRGGRRVRDPLPEIRFEEGDEIVFKGKLSAVMGVSNTEGIDIRGNEQFGLEGMRTESAVLMEGILGPDSSLAGKSLKQLNFRQSFGVLILAVHRRGRNLRERFEDERLEFGDTLLVQGPRQKMRKLFEEKDFINLSEPHHEEMRDKKSPIAIGAIVLFMLVGALSGPLGFDVPVVLTALLCALLVLVTGCILPNEAYKAIEWKVIFMIFGMLGVGLAMTESGLAQLIASGVEGFKDNPHLVLCLVYLVAAIMTELISNNAVAALLTPIAISVAMGMGVDARPFVVAVMFGSSASFSTPIGYQTNTFVYGAGGYKFGDFFKAGFPLAVIMWLLASYLIPLIWPF
ncbi:MAG: SLC13 family permease [Akkermansiaceae bacterium]